MTGTRVVSVAAFFTIAACHTGAGSPAPAPAPPAATTAGDRPGAVTSGPITAVPVTREALISSGAFRALRGDSALRAFIPEIAAQESGGECSIMRTGGSGATTALAYFPAKVKAMMQVSITFDSSGRLVRYSERRGVPEMPTKGMKLEQLDSLVRAQEAKTRSTMVSLDYAVDQGMAMNRGGNLPVVAVSGTVREIERLDKLGPPSARLERVRKLCGV